MKKTLHTLLAIVALVTANNAFAAKYVQHIDSTYTYDFTSEDDSLPYGKSVAEYSNDTTILKINHYYYNTSSEEYVLNQIDSMFTSGDTLCQISMEDDHDFMNMDKKIEDANGNVILRQRFYWSGSEWSKSSMETYTYNTNGQMTESQQYYVSGDQFVKSTRYTNVFNANGDLIETRIEEYNSNDDTFTKSYRERNVYSGTQLDSTIVYNGGSWGVNWSTSSWIEYYYANSKLDSAVHKNYYGGVTQYFLYAYSASVDTAYRFSESSSTVSYRILTEKDSKGNVVRDEMGYYNSSTDEYSHNYKYTYKYNATNDVTEGIEYTDGGNDWMYEMKTEFTYDTQGNLIHEVTTPYSSGTESWNNANRDEEFWKYNKNGNLMMEGDFDHGDDDGEKTYYFFHEKKIADMIAESFASTLTIYPNPTTDVLFIEGVEEGTITVFDLTGKVVARTNANGVARTNANGVARVNVSNLDKGMYLVEVKTETSRTVNRVVKN